MALYARTITALAWGAAFLFVAAGGMLTYEVLARYVLTMPTTWAAELSQLCLIWGGMLGMTWILKTNRHVAVDVLTDTLSPGGKRIAQMIAMSFVAFFSAVVTWKGGEIFWDSFVRGRTTGSMLDLPTWVTELAIPFGFGLLFIQALIEIGKAATGNGDLPAGGMHS